jgi:hypothetical protein
MNEKERARRQQQYLEKKRNRGKSKYLRTDTNLAPVRRTLNEPCGCGSGKPFKACCYRTDHQRFDLRNYMASYKNAMNRLRSAVQVKILAAYSRGEPDLRTAMDVLARKLQLQEPEKFIEENGVSPDFFRHDVSAPEDEFMSKVLYFEEIAFQYHMPGHQQPLFHELSQVALRKGAVKEFEKVAHDALVSGAYSAYGVLDVKTPSGAGRQKWVLLRDLFDGSLHEFKDPNFDIKMGKWDVIIGKLIVVNGFHTFETSYLTLEPRIRPFINRLLFLLYCKHEIEMEGKTMPNLKEKFQVIFDRFPIVNDPLENAGLFCDAIHDYVKTNPSDLLAIYKAIKCIRTNDESTIEADWKRTKSMIEAGNAKVTHDANEAISMPGTTWFGTASIASVTGFRDAIVALNPRYLATELVEEKHFVKIVYVGEPSQRKSADGGTDGATGTFTVFPSPEIILENDVGKIVEFVAKSYKEANRENLDDFWDISLSICTTKAIDSCENYIMLDEADAVIVNGLDDDVIDAMKAVCDTAAIELTGKGVAWNKGIPRADIWDVIRKVMLENQQQRRFELDGNARGMPRLGGYNEEEDGAWEEGDEEWDDDDRYDLLPEHVQTPVFVASCVRSWVMTPNNLLLGRTPIECVTDERLHDSLVMLVKQAERLLSSLPTELAVNTIRESLGMNPP